MNLGHQENLSRVWIFHSGPWGKSANIDVISLRYVRTCDHAFLAWDRNSIGHISFGFFRGRGWSRQHSGSRLLFFSRFWWLFERTRRRLGRIWFSRSGSPRGPLLLRRLRLRRRRLESVRNWLANFLEKVPYWIGVCPVSAQKEERDDEQGNPARTNEAIN